MKRYLSLFAMVIGMVVGALWGANAVLTYAQTDEAVCESPATPEAVEEITSSQRLLGQADYASLPDVPARMTTTQIILAPGASTQPFVSSGPTLVIVQEGTVTLTADEATISTPPEPSLGGISVETSAAEPALAEDVGVTDGEQISLNGGVNAQFSNATESEVRLLLVALTPGEA